MKKNAGKAPSIQFYYKDFLAKMSEHDPEAIGAWMLILIKIWHSNPDGSITKTLGQFARIMNTDQVNAQRLIHYFSSENIADVTEDNEKITIINRRTQRDAKLREDNRLRQENFRRNAKSNTTVIPDSPPASSSSSSSTSVKLQEYVSIFDQARKLYPARKRGLQPEFENFKKKYKNWIDILPLLEPAIKQQIPWRKKDGQYWKNFKTWINNSCWTEEPTQGTSAIVNAANDRRNHERSVKKALEEYKCFAAWPAEKVKAYIKKRPSRYIVMAAKHYKPELFGDKDA